MPRGNMRLPTATYKPPPFNTLALNKEGRITTNSMSYMHRLIPLDPATSGQPVIRAYRLPP